MTRPLRLATRKSKLALTQAGMVADQITARTGRECELVTVTTTGDVSEQSLAAMGGTGVFVGAVREAIMTGVADLGVHSLKDLPTAAHEDLFIGAVPQREDPRDVLVSRHGLRLEQLPSGARVGTGSPRRAAQLRAGHPRLEVADIRGNVDTRLAKLAAGDFDAIVLAHAGLSRLGLAGLITQVLEVDVMLPAPGQGALALEARRTAVQADEQLRAVLAALDDAPTHAAVIGERAVLATLEAGCSAPVGTLAAITSVAGEHATMTLHALAASVDGARVFRMTTTGQATEASALGRQLAEQLLAAGAADLLGELTS